MIMEDLSVKMRKCGRITIPAQLRKKFGIKGGTRINIRLDEKLQRIILTPLTRASVNAKLRS